MRLSGWMGHSHVPLPMQVEFLSSAYKDATRPAALKIWKVSWLYRASFEVLKLKTTLFIL